jgi:hypothetical protein
MTGAAAGHDRLLFYFARASELPSLVDNAKLSPDAWTSGGVLALVTARHRFGVLWLTDSAELLPEQARGTADVRPGVRAPAGELIRITAAVSGAQYWPRWARRHLVGRRRRRLIDTAAGGSSGRWWIVTDPVPATAWLRIDTATGDNLWPQPQQQAIGAAAAAARSLTLSAYRRADVDWPTSTTPHRRHRPRPAPRS